MLLFILSVAVLAPGKLAMRLNWLAKLAGFVCRWTNGCSVCTFVTLTRQWNEFEMVMAGEACL